MTYRNDPYDPKQVALLDAAALDDAVATAEKAFTGATDVAALTALKPLHLGDRAPVSLARREIGALPPAAKADAAGADAVVFAGETVDPYNGKAVRASAGSLFHVDVVRTDDPAAVIATIRDAGLTVLAADAYGDQDLDTLADDGALDGPTAWVFGSEAHGLPDELAEATDARVHVPLYGRAESLNLAAAAAVCLYASARALRRE